MRVTETSGYNEMKGERIYRMWNLMAALLVTMFLMTPGTAYAGERAGAITLSPFVGGYTFDGAERLETRPVVGLRLGYDFNKNFGLEGTFSYVPSHFTKAVPGTVTVFSSRLEGIYNFMPDRKIVPYLAIGGGATTLEMPDNAAITHPHNHSPTINGGVGIKWFLNEKIAIRADYHQNFLIDTSDANNKVQDCLENYEYSVGLHILFGGT
jgi:OOP family OmpA-OmpF porin